MKQKEYIVYKGDKFLCMGTADECAAELGVLSDTIRSYTTPTYQKRLSKRKRVSSSGYLTVSRLEEDEE